MREDLSSEKLEDRVRKMQQQLEVIEISFALDLLPMQNPIPHIIHE